jgi:hypothetical protein
MGIFWISGEKAVLKRKPGRVSLDARAACISVAPGSRDETLDNWRRR